MPREKEKAPYVTRADIEEFLELEEERKSLNRQADDLARKAAPLKDKLSQFVAFAAGPSKSIERSGYVLAMLTRAGRVDWKSEFIHVAGETEAERLVRECPKSEFLSVEKAG
jgi:uncharacterized caspase-like protein